MSIKPLRKRLERLEKQFQLNRNRKQSNLSIQGRRLQRATTDPYIWATQYSETFNPHWLEEGRNAPFEKFPSAEEYPHLPDVFELLASERIVFFEKSRDVMLTWACLAFLTNKSMVVPAREVHQRSLYRAGNRAIQPFCGDRSGAWQRPGRVKAIRMNRNVTYQWVAD